jgi:[citrate (pro-3S)-lyase] ligase
VNIELVEIDGFYQNPKDNFVIIGKDFAEVAEKIKAAPTYIVKNTDPTALSEYKEKRGGEAILLAVNPDGDDYRPCVRAILDIYDGLTDGTDEKLEIYVHYKLAALPTDRLRELSEKRFFLKPFRMEDENRILAENIEAKVDIITEEFGVSEEIAREAEVIVCNVTPVAGEGGILEDIQNNGKNTLYVFGGSQLMDLMNIPEFKEQFLATAKNGGYNVSLNIGLDRGLFAYFNDILSLSLTPGDRVMLTLDPNHMSLMKFLNKVPAIKPLENAPAMLVWLKKHLEESGVKLFCYIFPILNNKQLTPYEKILPRYSGVKGNIDFDKHISNFEEFIILKRNYLSASGVRFFYNTTLNKSKELCYLNINHYTKIGNAILSKEILELIENSDFLDETYTKKIESLVKLTQKYGQSFAVRDIFTGINEYITDLANHRKPGKSGAIVMNCNPVTNGHMYLIETAARTVDYLFIFVVEEDRSEFPFEERIALVRENCKDLKNVTVLPSGKFIISQLTFPEYFMKADKSELEPSGKPSVINDVTAFAVKIAVALNIKVRFAGEEPLDPVTREYNRVMANLLPFYGVEFVEIKRKETDGEVISASRVRKLLHEGNFEAIKPLVPDATFKYLEKKYGNKT